MIAKEQYCVCGRGSVAWRNGLPYCTKCGKELHPDNVEQPSKEPINAPSEGQSSGAQLTNRGEVMNPPASAAQGAEAGNLNTPHRHGLGASPQGDAAQATPIPAAPSVVLSSKPLHDPFPPGSITPATMHHHVLAIPIEEWDKLFAYKEWLKQVKADWEECVTLREAEIERLTRERDEFRSQAEANTTTMLMNVVAERDRLRAALESAVGVIARSHSKQCVCVYCKRQIAALRPADETTAPQAIGGGPFGCEHNWNGSGPCPVCHR